MHEEHDSTGGSNRTSVGRRDYMRLLGAAGSASMVGASAVSSGAAAPMWEQQADERIQQHRTADLNVVVQDQNGDPVPDADVEVKQQSHDFHFGTAVNADLYVYGEDKNGNQVDQELVDKYRRITHEKFNTAVLENAHKWRFWENDPQRAHDATDMLLENEMDVRGHVCIWGRLDVGAIPQDVLQAARNGDAETIRRRSLQHIRDIISYYGDDIMEWEVVNEAMHAYRLQRGIYGDQINWRDTEDIWTGEVVPWKSPIMADWYQAAEEAAPEGVDIGINDFNVLTSSYDYAKDWYPAWFNHIKNSGVDIDFMGMQSHMRVDPSDQNGEDRRLSPSQLKSDLDAFAETTDSIRITEFDFAQSSQRDLTQEEAADYFYKFLKTTFSHPAVEQFLMWGFWDRMHWSSPWSPMFDRQFNKKPGYDVWENLVFGQWWNDEAGTTDSSGTYSTNAFLGTHKVMAGDTTKTVEVTDSSASRTVRITVQNGGNNPGDEMEPVMNGQLPQDMDSDGHYEDITGDGELDFNDLVGYYQHKDDPAMQNHTAAYDYTDDGELNFNDLVALYQEMQGM